MIHALLSTLNHTRERTIKLVADLRDEQLYLQPAQHMNHAAWTLGHLLPVDHSLLNLLTGEPIPDWMEAWKAVYGMNSTPSNDPGQYQPKTILLERLARVRQPLMARLGQMKPKDFERPNTNQKWRERFPTIGDMLVYYGIWHETYHSGQLSAWRRVLGLPPV